MSNSVSWTCGKCGETVTAGSNTELGAEVAAHLSSCPKK